MNLLPEVGAAIAIQNHNLFAQRIHATETVMECAGKA